MPLVQVPLFQPIKLRVNDGRLEHLVQVLDCDEQTLLVRVPASLISDQAPEHVTISYGHQNFFWEVPAEARATYDQWWFVERPDEMKCRRFQRRAFVRIAYRAQMTAIPMASGDEQPPYAITTNNLSAGGLLATSPLPIGREGDDVMVFLGLPEQAPIPTVSEIVRVQDAPHGHHRYGLRFKDLHGEAQEQVAHFVARQIQQSLTKGHDITCREG